METMDLTPDEVQVVRKIREDAREKDAKPERIRYILHLASAYEEWLQDHGRRSSFSTFCDEYGYYGDDRSQTFDFIETIRERVRELVNR